MLLALLPAAPAHAKDRFVYVSMGDSYTSGPLVLPHDTRWVPQDCGQSARNWAHLVGLSLHADEFRDVSCGSATIDDFYHSQRGLPLGHTNLPQLWALNDKVDAVTVGIGGNDVGFVGDALSCIRTTPEGVGNEPDCHTRFVHNGVDTVSQAIDRMRVKLGRALDDIHAKAPHAAVFVVSYPDALPDNGRACWPYVPIRQNDMAYLVDKFKEMNHAEQSAAQAHRATYVDIYTPSIGHDACKPAGLAWVNAVVIVPPSYPAHPNDLSFVHSAPIVANAIRTKLHR